MKKGATWIDRTLIESPFCIGLCQTEKQYKHELKRLKVSVTNDCWIAEDKDANVSEFTCGGISVFIVSIRVQPKTTHLEIIGLLVHEAVHVWQRIKQSIGEDDPSDEFEAYAIQRIAQNLIDAYRLKK
jgi:hypothetical protein